MLCSHFTQNCIFYTFWRLKILVLWRKLVENLLIFVYLFCPKNGAIDFTKTFITQEWLVVESCPAHCWIAFLMLYQLVHNIRSYFNELILAWSAQSTCTSRRILHMPWRQLQRNIFLSSETSLGRLGRQEIVTLKTSSRSPQDMPTRCLQEMRYVSPCNTCHTL